MTEIGIGILGGGYMGKAHAAAMAAVGVVFNTALRPRLEMVCASSPQSARKYRDAYGFRRAASTWQELVQDPLVEAVVIASPQDTHRAIAEAALRLGKPVFCEKPLGASLADSRAMVAAAEASGTVNVPHTAVLLNGKDIGGGAAAGGGCRMFRQRHHPCGPALWVARFGQ
mgnify:CR=1 FL=1